MGAERKHLSRFAVLSAWLLSSSLAAACGDDTGADGPAPDARDAGERILPGRVTPPDWRPDASIDSGLPDDLFASYDAGPCCEIEFALAARPGEVYAVLRGTDVPFDGRQGVPLAYEEGAWRATVCIPLGYSGMYYYEVYSVPDSELNGGVEPATEPIPVEVVEAADWFHTVRHNESAPTADDPVLGTVNQFVTADACVGADAGLHSMVSSSTTDDDAGM